MDSTPAPADSCRELLSRVKRTHDVLCEAFSRWKGAPAASRKPLGLAFQQAEAEYRAAVRQYNETLLSYPE